jgi:hypothetical protein
MFHAKHLCVPFAGKFFTPRGVIFHPCAGRQGRAFPPPRFNPIPSPTLSVAIGSRMHGHPERRQGGLPPARSIQLLRNAELVISGD